VNESNFVTSIYNKISEIINVEKSLISNEKDIITLQTIMDNTITLGTYTKESVTYKSYELQMKNYVRVKQNYEKQLTILKKQFRQITNSEYSAIDQIEIPSLSFTPLSMGSTEVILASLDVEIAKEQLALYNRRNVKGTSGSTVPSFTLNGDAGINYINTTANTVDYTFGAGASYNGPSFSVGTRLNVGIDSSGVTPSISLSGSWTNNADSKKDILEKTSLENSVSIKELEYTQALLDYQISSQSLISDIFNYEHEVSEFNQSKDFNQQVFETQTEAYSLGLAKESDVYSARVSIALDEKQEQLLALKGRVLAERIKSMQF
jgi:outer membrane protein TolC